MVKRGVTLIELMVAMTIFVIVMSLAIGGFVSINRARILVGNQKNSQQKIRIANEMIVRYAKQAEYVQISGDGRTLSLYFDIDEAETKTSKVFEVCDRSGGFSLAYADFTGNPTGGICSGGNNLILGSENDGIILADSQIFTIDGIMPSVLQVRLDVKNEIAGQQALSDSFTIRNAIILENLK